MKALTGTGTGGVIEVVTGFGGGDCGYPFQTGGSYFVYAAKNAEGKLETSICSRTRELKKADEDLKYLREKANAPESGELQVRVGSPAAPAAPGERIVLEGGGLRRIAETDAGGAVVFAGLPPGEYVVRAEADEPFADDPRVRLHAKGCADVALFRALRVTGRVTDRSGDPASRVEVQARSVDGVAESSATTDAEGRYLLYIVRPGRYYTGINLNTPATQYSPYPQWFYPGTMDASRAVTAEFSGKAGARQHDFVMPDRQPARVIRGTVSKPDGGVPPVARVIATDGKGGVVAQETADSQGNFTLPLFADTPYLLHAVWPGNTPDDAASAVPVRIDAGSAPLTLRLALTEPGNSFLDESGRRP